MTNGAYFANANGMLILFSCIPTVPILFLPLPSLPPPPSLPPSPSILPLSSNIPLAEANGFNQIKKRKLKLVVNKNFLVVRVWRRAAALAKLVNLIFVKV